MSLEKEFVPYEESLILKELGLDQNCCASYGPIGARNYKELTYGHADYNIGNCIGAPTFSQAFKFFREKYPELDFGIGKIYNGTNNYHFHINLQWEFFEGTYEEAELACLKKLIEIVKEQKW